MIRMIQRRLIIPRGDTGSFSIPYLKTISPGDVAVFTIFDIRTKTKMYQKLIAAEGDILNIAFTHGDTVNLKPGKYLWDIKFYTNPQIIDDELVNGDEVDSYYAGFSLPECEIRETGDTLLTSDDAPTSTISPESLNIINAAINEILNTKRAAVEAAETASSKADAAAESAENASNSASAASQSAATAEARVNEIESLSVEVDTGLEGTDASVTYTPSTGVLSFIIPRGNTGNGIASCVLNNDFTLTINYTNGDSTTTIPIRGDTPHLTIGEVTEGPHAIATITGTDANPILNLTLPNANVPTRLSQLTDDIGVAGKANSADLAAVATSGSYTDLGNKPYIPVKTSDLTNDSNYAVDSNYVHTDNNYTTAEKNKLSGIAAGAEVNVNADWNATSGDAYILNKPTKVSDFTNDAGYLTQHQDISGKADKSEIPTKVSQLQNDEGYLTSYTETDPTVPAWAKTAQKPSYTAAEVGAPTVAEMQQAIANVNTMKIHICVQGEYNSETGVPTIQNPNIQTFYLVPGGEGSNLFIEWVYINSAWERFGSADVEISVQDVQINGTSIVSNGIANIQKASSSNLGAVGIEPQSGVDIASNGKLEINPASTADIKKGEHTNKPIVPFKQDVAAFYGLATAAGDVTQSVSNNPVGTYTDEAKTAIQQMLDVPSKSEIPDTSIYAEKTEALFEKGTGLGSVKTKDFEFGGIMFSNEANGLASYAEGLYTVSSGQNAHAEGYATKALSINSHAEGLGTIASGPSLHVSGTYNIDDSYENLPEWESGVSYSVGDKVKITTTNDDNTTTVTGYKCKTANSDIEFTQNNWTKNPKLNYSEIIGNGANANSRSNAYALDWDGNGHYMGDVYVHANADSTGGTKLATIEDIPEAPVQDVQVNGTSVVQDGVANVPIAGASTPGVAVVNGNYGITIGTANHDLRLISASDNAVKNGVATMVPITPSNQHKSTFYGLAKAAGHDEASSTEPLGTYTPEAKGAIQSMLGVSDLIAPAENNLVASKAYAIGDIFTANGKLYKATAAIAADAAIIPEIAGEEVSGANCVETKLVDEEIKDVQVNGVSVLSDGVANIPIAGGTSPGVVISDTVGTKGVYITPENKISVAPATESNCKNGNDTYRPITTFRQHASAFYGLAKAAGDTTQAASDNAVGTYTDEAKSAIRNMIGAISNTDYADNNTAGVVKVNSGLGIGIDNSSKTIFIDDASDINVKVGTESYKPITPRIQHNAVFYGLAKAAGDATQSISSNAVGTYTDEAKAAIKSMIGVNVEDVQMNGTSIISGGVADVPVASTSRLGVSGVEASFGILVNNNGKLYTNTPNLNEIKSGSQAYKPIVPANVHTATFYGLAKASGDTTQSASSNAVGTYTDNAKASIKSMLGIVDGSTGTVDITGTTPTITAVENTRYVCGEVTSLSFTPAASGICIVRFTSGSTVTVLTLPSTVKFPEWFDSTSLETNTIYEICITDGIYGAVMSWAQ